MSNKRQNKSPTVSKKTPTSNPVKPKLVAQQIQTTYQGPIHQPQDLRQYEDIQPGFAERIIKMAENESVHRQKIENRIINSERLLSTVGQIPLLGCLFSDEQKNNLCILMPLYSNKKTPNKALQRTHKRAGEQGVSG